MFILGLPWLLGMEAVLLTAHTFVPLIVGNRSSFLDCTYRCCLDCWCRCYCEYEGVSLTVHTVVWDWSKFLTVDADVAWIVNMKEFPWLYTPLFGIEASSWLLVPMLPGLWVIEDVSLTVHSVDWDWLHTPLFGIEASSWLLMPMLPGLWVIEDVSLTVHAAVAWIAVVEAVSLTVGLETDRVPVRKVEKRSREWNFNSPVDSGTDINPEIFILRTSKPLFFSWPSAKA